MIKRIGIGLAAFVFTATIAGAQPSRPVELGIDAGATIGLGDNSVTVVDIPAQAFRAGFFMNDRISLEPKIGLTTISGEGDTFTSYIAELGLLYHFYRSRLRTDVYPYGSPLSAFYVRPFCRTHWRERWRKQHHERPPRRRTRDEGSAGEPAGEQVRGKLRTHLRGFQLESDRTARRVVFLHSLAFRIGPASRGADALA